jgi:hypothetical protein
MKLLSLLRSAVATLAVALALPASAAFYVDDTTGSPTFNRALSDFSDVSAVGTDVAYDVFAFSVSVDGLYSFRSIAAGFFKGSAWDQYLFLYEGAFDPASPLSGGVAGNDDFNGIGSSGFDVALLVNTAYYLVTTGFGNSDSGKYLNIIRGPGEILPVVPEPGTYALLALGLFAVSLAVRRRTGVDHER